MAALGDAMETTAPLAVIDSATITCVRRRPGGPAGPKKLSQAVLCGDAPAPTPLSSAGARDALVFGTSGEAEFSSGWQVLMGQREVVNYIRSSRDELVPMRYPGEFTFPGGCLDEGESPEEAARRELLEEFGLEAPADARLRLLSVRQTRPVRNKSNVIFNYVIHEEENPWLHSFSADDCNARLVQRRGAFEAKLGDGSFWDLGREGREALSPEVVQVAWLDVADAVEMSYLPFVNDYQAGEFARLGIRQRDPVFLTLVSLMEVESFPSLQSLLRAAEGVDLAEARAAAIWLKEGLTPEEVAAVFRQRAEGGQESRHPFRAERFAELRARRLADETPGSAA